MKKIKIFIAVVLIALITTIILLNNVSLAGSCWWTSCDYYNSSQVSENLNKSTGKVYLNAHNITYHFDNVYCIQFGQNMTSGTFRRWATAVIDGDYATLYQYNTNNEEVAKYENFYSEYNNYMAALLSTFNLETGYATWYNEGYLENADINVEGGRSEVQIGVWADWNNWVATLPTANWKTIFPAGGSNYNGAAKYGGQTGINTIRKYVEALEESHEYSVKIHYLKEVNGYGQRYILVERLQPKTKIIIEKAWDDDNNVKSRPESVQVKVSGYLYNDPSQEKYEKTVTLNAANNWKAEVLMPARANDQENKQLIRYKVEEVDNSQNYQSKIEVTQTSYTSDPKLDSKGEALKDADGNIIYDYSTTKTIRTTTDITDAEDPYVIKWNSTVKITNKLEPIDIPVKKVWEDNNNKYEMRPGNVKVKLYANGEDTGKSLTLKEANNWSGTFENFPKYNTNGNEIVYTVKESVPTGYVETITGNVEDGFTITNSLDKINLKVYKKWDDEENRHEMRPDSITVELIWSGIPTGETLTLNEANNWSGEFKDIDTNNGKYYFRVEEVQKAPGYESKNVRTVDADNATVIETITNTLVQTSVPVKKVWNDDDDKYGNRPDSITVELLKNGKSTGKTLELNDGNNWSGRFKFLDKGYTYTIKEVSETGYTSTITGNADKGYTITNKTELTSISVQKKWDDDDNRDGIRSSSVKVTLYENGVATDKTATLSESNNWNYTFKNLPKYKNKELVSYTVQENSIQGYEEKITGNASSGYKITNKHDPERITIKITKKWDDVDDLDEYRPDSITLKLLANGEPATDAKGKDISKVILTASDNASSNIWEYEIKDLYRYYNQGKEISYSIEEVSLEKNANKYTVGDVNTEITTDQDGKKVITFALTNTHEPHYDGYIEISGKVWLDKEDGKGNDINGKLDDNEPGIGEIKVTLKDANGKQFDATSTAETSKDDGTYTIKVNYDNSKNVYKLYEDSNTVKEKLKTAYVEFEYDGIKYTTVSTAKTGANTSKAIENEETRSSIDNTHSTVTFPTKNPDEATITASTKNVITFENYEDITTTTDEVTLKYCNGDGTYIRTNPEGAWKSIKKGTNDLACTDGKGHDIIKYSVDVEKIQNVNLGLFEREQPDVAIFSDLSKVEVTMNGQKYTYLYGVRSNNNNNADLQVKFQNKGTYTYRRPVNPADIAYIKETNKNAMSVVVTYEVKVANLSTTLQTTINEISNYFDKQYTLNTEGWTTDYESYSDYNKATKENLNITLKPQTESSAIELKYTVSLDAIKGLLNEEATLNNAVEIESYTTRYGEGTAYAEQRRGGDRIKQGNDLYAGYDYNSHPGNAEIFINNEGRLEAKNPEDDTDIAPSFVLCKGEEKVLSGTVWEDLDDNENDDERLGNGYYDLEEKQVENVKVELYELVTNSDGSISSQLAKLYKIDENNSCVSEDSIVYTDANGKYSFDGVVTGEYFIKFTYGNKTNPTEEGEEVLENPTTMDGGETTVNARNYKSTIITDPIIKNIFGKDYEEFSEEEKMWHITHEDGYSVAVDNMIERLEIEDLQYSNFDTPLNMVSYSKPFKTQVEFETTGQSQVKIDGSEKNGGIVNGSIEASNELNKLDFGIAERPREDLFVQKTITNLKVSLANGQVLIDGNPSEGLNYVKAVGFKQEITTGEQARKAIDKQLYIEMDAGLIQGSTLQLDYQVKLVNNNEIDYDYGNLDNYTDIVNEKDGKNKYDSFITTNSLANYYYYGNSAGLSEMKATIEFVDYMSDNVVFTDSTQWTTVDKNELNGLVDREVINVIEGEKYKILRGVEGKSITLDRDTTVEMKMSVSKLLSSSDDDNVYDNHVEIIKIDGKTARTIQESRQGEQIEKSYKPGDYVPSTNSEREQDSDRVKAVITPPTGITNYITMYAIVGVIGLTIIAIAILIIKKKVLNK